MDHKLTKTVAAMLGSAFTGAWNQRSADDMAERLAPIVIDGLSAAAQTAKWTQSVDEGVWAGARALKP